MRRAAAAAVLGAALALVAASASRGAGEAAATYLVRPDLRLCPSPACGGAWVRRVNRARTRCADGTLRRECYAGRVEGPMLGAGDLVHARLLPDGGAGARVRVLQAWRRTPGPEPTGTVVRVRDTGVRCVAAPCFSMDAVPLGLRGHVKLSDLDLGRLSLPDAVRDRALRLLAGPGLLVAGRSRVVRDAGPAGDGRVLVATAAWLPPSGRG